MVTKTGQRTHIDRDNVNVGVPNDLSDGASKLEKADANRKQLGGTTDAEREAHWGDKNVDLWDKVISPEDLAGVQKQVMKAIEEGRDPMDVYRTIIEEGKNEPGAGLIFRQDKWTEFLSGNVSSSVILRGTATEGTDGQKKAGQGVVVEGQFDYTVSPKEMQSWVDQAREGGKNVVVVPDQDEYGEPLQPKVRLNVTALLKDDGVYELAPSLRIENIPAINLMELVKEAGNEKFELAWAPLLTLLSEKDLLVTIQSVGDDGASLGVVTNVNRLHALTGEKFIESDKVPDLAVKGNVDGDVVEIEGQKFFDLNNFDLALGKIRAIRKGDSVEVQFQTADGSFKKLDLGKYVPPDSGIELEDGNAPLMLLTGLLGQVLMS